MDSSHGMKVKIPSESVENPPTWRSTKNWPTSFLTLSMGVFLCATSCLILITALSSFAISYQTRDLLVELMALSENKSSESDWSTPSRTTASPDPIAESTVDWTISDPTLDSSTAATTDEYITGTATEEFATDTTTEEFVTDTTMESTEYPTDKVTYSTVKMKPKNPVSVLNEITTKTQYLCIVTCSTPKIITAQLTVNMSTTPIINDWFTFATTVQTNELSIAKQKVAYQAVAHISKDLLVGLIESPEWYEPISLACNSSRLNNKYRDCKK